MSHCSAANCVALSLDLAHPCSLRARSGPHTEQASGDTRGAEPVPRTPSSPPLRYWKLDPAQVYASGPNAWDTAVHDASEEYKHRMVGGPPLGVGSRVGGRPLPLTPTARPDPALPASPAQSLL